MNREEKAIAANAEEALSEPGVATALLAVLVMIVSTGVLAFLIYIVMITIVPDEPRQIRKDAQFSQPILHAQGTRHITS